MENQEWYILFYLAIFILIFLVDYFLILKNKYNTITGKNKIKKEKKNITIMEIEYLTFKFKLIKEKLYVKWVLLYIATINALIISFVSCVISFLPLDMIWQMLIGFVLLIGLIYSMYELFGRYLVKRGMD